MHTQVQEQGECLKRYVLAFYILKCVQVVQNGRKVKVNIVKTEEKGWGK